MPKRSIGWSKLYIARYVNDTKQTIYVSLKSIASQTKTKQHTKSNK